MRLGFRAPITNPLPNKVNARCMNGVFGHCFRKWGWCPGGCSITHEYDSNTCRVGALGLVETSGMHFQKCTEPSECPPQI